MSAEEPAVGKFHEVSNEEAGAVVAVAEHALLHNEAIGRLLRNMYGRVQALEREVAELKAKKAKKPKRSGPP